MTEPGASPEDPWVKASSADAHAGEGRAGRARARRGSGRRGVPQLSPESPLLSGPRGCREDSSHPACAKVGRQMRHGGEGTKGTCLGGGAGAAGIIQRGRRPCGLARLGFGRAIQRSPHRWYVHLRVACAFSSRQRSDRFLPCLMLQVEYAFSDNSLDPGECPLHRLRVRNDPCQLCRSLWSCQPHLSTVHCHCAKVLT